VEIFQNWRIWILVYLVLLGVWGVIVKVASIRLNALTVTFVSTTAAWLTVVLFSLPRLNFSSRLGVSVAVLCGVIGGITSLIFYGVLKYAPASVVIPLTTLYILVTVVLSCAFLGETISLRQAAGILLGIAAVFLLTT
jgi:transporter family protein